MREHFRVLSRRLDHPLDLVPFVRIVHLRPVHNGELAHIVAAHSKERGIGRVHMKPLRKQQVDLVNVLLQRRVAGRVVSHIERRPQSLARVEGNLGGLAVGLPSRRPRRAGSRHQRPVPQSFVVVVRRRQQEFRQVLGAQNVENESCKHQRQNQGRGVKNAAKPAPALALRIVEYLFVWHSASRCTSRRISGKLSAHRTL